MTRAAALRHPDVRGRVAGLAALGAVLATAIASADAGAPIAVRFGDGSDPIPISEVDAASGGKCTALVAQIGERAGAALDALIDAQLLASSPDGLPDVSAPAPVTDAEIDRFRVERAADFERDGAPTGSARRSAVQREAIRHHLETQAQQRAREAALEALRGQHRIERLLPGAETLVSPLAPDRVVARVDAEPILAAALEARAALSLYRLRGELARERLRRADALIAERLLAREAERRDTDVDALIGDAAETPGEAEWDAFVAEERAAGRPAPDRSRAAPLLAFRARHAAREALVARLRAAAGVEVAIAVPSPPRLAVHVDGAPALGAVHGARLVVYTNYRCRACRLAHAELDRLLAASDDVRVIFRDWIPQYDPGAREAAALARCAARQGRFASMRAALLAGDPPDFGLGWALDGEAGLVARAGVDRAALSRCLVGDARVVPSLSGSDGSDVARAIDRDAEQARALGFERAPAFVAEGLPLSGVQSAEGLAEALREGLAVTGEALARERDAAASGSRGRPARGRVSSSRTLGP